MKDVLEFFRGLLDANRWPPRWKCGYWSDFHGWLYIISDLMIFLAYFLIPVIILSYFNSKKTTIRFRAVYLLFAAFIVLCGTTHLMDALMFWIPAYRFNAICRLATAVVSLLTVYQLIKTLPQMVKLRTPMELEMEIARREQVERNLAEANMRLAAFASIASHDLQEPLRKIQTYAKMINTDKAETFTEVNKVYMSKILHSANRMQDLIKDVLTLSSLSEKANLQLIDPREAVMEAVENVELIIHEKKARVTVEQLPLINANMAYLVQLFSNLIGNALKFNERNPEITITGKTENNKVIIRVADNGIGIASEFHEKVFEAFERGHAKSRYPGTGMGLAICKRMMEIHHGDLSVESEPRRGSTFVLSFPDPNA